MGENRVERNHQTKEMDRIHLSRMKYSTRAKNSEAKIQNIQCSESITQLQLAI